MQHSCNGNGMYPRWHGMPRCITANYCLFSHQDQCIRVTCVYACGTSSRRDVLVAKAVLESVPLFFMLRVPGKGWTLDRQACLDWKEEPRRCIRIQPFPLKQNRALKQSAQLSSARLLHRKRSTRTETQPGHLHKVAATRRPRPHTAAQHRGEEERAGRHWL